MIRLLFHITMIVGLTLLTQLGGVAWFAAIITTRGILQRLFAFVLAYIAISIGAVYAAPALGREALPCVQNDSTELVIHSPVFCALNRHYVTPETAAVTKALAAHMNTLYPGTLTQVLDAGFPFLTGFPLLPHLSHDDGRKVDLAFYYRDQSGYLRGVTRSPIGYWAFESQGADCPEQYVSLRWDMAWLQPYWPDISLDEARVGDAVKWLTSQEQVEKVFVEPPLARRLGVTAQKLRFQGCRAARHDDHIHFQIAG